MAASAMRKFHPASRAADFGGATKVPIPGGEELAGREAARGRVLERDELFQNLPPRPHRKEEEHGEKEKVTQAGRLCHFAESLWRIDERGFQPANSGKRRLHAEKPRAGREFSPRGR